MVLGGVLGYTLQRAFDWPNATVLGLLLGMVMAQFVPAPGCGPRQRSG